MIIDIPSYNHFQSSGLGYLNLSMSTILDLLRLLEDVEIGKWDTEGEVTSEFWEAAQQPLILSLSLLHQGSDLLMKSHICKVSPFLLIANQPQHWPKRCDSHDSSFSDFYSLDSKDLTKAFNTVASFRLDRSFVSVIDRVRVERNRYMHSVVQNAHLAPKQVIADILLVHDSLVQPQGWLGQRRAYLERNHEAVIFSTDYVNNWISWEILQTLRLIGPALVKRHFGISPKKRFYICPQCDCEEKFKVAQLEQNTPISTSLKCYACGITFQVSRSHCRFCDGNVLSNENFCLSCGRSQEESF